MEPKGTTSDYTGQSSTGARAIRRSHRAAAGRASGRRSSGAAHSTLGSAADEGLAEAVFQLEAEWETPVVDRLLEYGLNGEFEICGERETPRSAARKSGSHRSTAGRHVPPHRLQAQPRTRAEAGIAAADLHRLCSAAASGDDRTELGTGQAGYIAFGQERQFVPMLARGKTGTTCCSMPRLA